MVRDHQISIFAWLHVRFLEWVFHWGFGWGAEIAVIYVGDHSQFINKYFGVLVGGAEIAVDLRWRPQLIY